MSSPPSRPGRPRELDVKPSFRGERSGQGTEGELDVKPSFLPERSRQGKVPPDLSGPGKEGGLDVKPSFRRISPAQEGQEELTSSPPSGGRDPPQGRRAWGDHKPPFHGGTAGAVSVKGVSDGKVNTYIPFTNT
ncbi:hypothetical protein MMC12_004132 [Toensbergia leucococca]|nr:hypothetical protein [Toensbergia leucococca]